MVVRVRDPRKGTVHGGRLVRVPCIVLCLPWGTYIQCSIRGLSDATIICFFVLLRSMWRVAKTLDDSPSTDNTSALPSPEDPTVFGKLSVPTNAFQEFMLDGVTRPSLLQRCGSFVAPVFPLFRAGVLTSATGYGLVDVVIRIRSLLLPSFTPVTQPVNVLYASIYTGCFMAVVSNIRYQLLQGLIEPFIDRSLSRFPKMRNVIIFIVRWMNGLLGSVLAITGMRACGLQKLR